MLSKTIQRRLARRSGMANGQGNWLKNSRGDEAGLVLRNHGALFTDEMDILRPRAVGCLFPEAMFPKILFLGNEFARRLVPARRRQNMRAQIGPSGRARTYSGPQGCRNARAKQMFALDLWCPCATRQWAGETEEIRLIALKDRSVGLGETGAKRACSAIRARPPARLTPQPASFVRMRIGRRAIRNSLDCRAAWAGPA
jgi:hypothetical protein